MPPSGAFSYKPTKHLADMYCNGRRVLPMLNVRQHKSFDIAPDESKYVGYRRNYFCLDTAYHLELQPTAENPHERELARGHITVNDHIVKAFAISISGIDNSHSGKVVELVQFSPKRDHGKKGRPPLHRVAPTLSEFVSPLGNGPAAHSIRSSSYAEGPILQYQDARDPCQLDKSLYGHGEEVPDGTVTNHTWERIQFKNATANNGRRRQNQQAFMVVVTLWADIRETRENGRAPYWLPVAKCHSDEVVIRGRSPNHYHPKGGGASAVASASISRMQLEAPAPQAMGLGGGGMRLSAGHSSHAHFPALTNSHHATNTVGNFRGQTFNSNNESTFGQLRTHWSDTGAYPSANTHHYGGAAQPFDPSRGADRDWESGSEPSLPMELDPLLEGAGPAETIESRSPFEGSQRRSSSLSCSAFSPGIAETPFTVFSPHDLSALAESPCALAASPRSDAWGSIEGMRPMDLAAAADHDASPFSPAGHDWTADLEDGFGDASILLVSPTLAATAAPEHLSTPSYPRLDGAAASPQSEH
jgi:meiosis-specific transcription factor NDT80